MQRFNQETGRKWIRKKLGGRFGIYCGYPHADWIFYSLFWFCCSVIQWSRTLALVDLDLVLHYGSLAMRSCISNPSLHFSICKMGITSTITSYCKDWRRACSFAKCLAYCAAELHSLVGILSTLSTFRLVLLLLLFVFLCHLQFSWKHGFLKAYSENLSVLAYLAQQ